MNSTRLINHRRGKIAQNIGKNFEDIFERASLRSQVTATRMPDGCRQIGAHKLIRVKTPFDWILSTPRGTALIDTKTSKENFPFSKIEEHQISEMIRHQDNNVRCGYVIWLRDVDQVIFVSAYKLRAAQYAKRGSIESGDGILLGRSQDFDVRKIWQ